MKEMHIIDIHKIAYTKLSKMDVYTFYKQVVSVVKKHYTKDMHIDSIYDLLIASQSKNRLLTESEEDRNMHYLSPEINKLKEKRFKFAALITNQMRTLEKAGFANKMHLVKLIKPVVKSYLVGLRKNNQQEVSQLIAFFFKEIENDKEVKEAFYELGLKPYLDELESIDNAWNNAFNKRMEETKKSRGSTLPIQRELQFILRSLFEQVNYYQHVYKDVDYTKLITGLNRVIASYTKQIKTRETKSRNKKLKAKEAELAKLKKEADAKVIDKKQAGTDINTFETTDLKNVPKGDHNLKKPDKGKENDDLEDK